jgi:hypothetical protein
VHFISMRPPLGSAFTATTARAGLWPPKKRLVETVELRKVAHIDEKHLHRRDVVQLTSASLEYRFKVGQGLGGLGGEVLPPQFSGLRFEAQLAADEQQAAGKDTLGVRADCCRGGVGLNRCWHGDSFSAG